MIGQGKNGTVADLQVGGGYLHAARSQCGDLLFQVRKVDCHTVAHNAHHAGAENAGGHQIQDEFSTLVDNGVSRIVAALIADHDVLIFGKQVHHTTLSFVSPVDSYDCCKHKSLPIYIIFISSGYVCVLPQTYSLYHIREKFQPDL